jgi:phage-related protein
VKELRWIGSSKKDLIKFPKEIIQEMGYALYCAQKGGYYKKTKSFKGCGSGVYEITAEYDTNAYRAVYIVNIDDVIYVVHCFQKKAKRGIKTPREEIAIIKQRLKFLRAEINRR